MTYLVPSGFAGPVPTVTLPETPTLSSALSFSASSTVWTWLSASAWAAPRGSWYAPTAPSTWPRAWVGSIGARAVTSSPTFAVATPLAAPLGSALTVSTSAFVSCAWPETWTPDWSVSDPLTDATVCTSTVGACGADGADGVDGS